jgi:uncharacterized membrane protein
VARFVRSRGARVGLVASLLAVTSFAGAVPVGAASSIRVTTPYPAVAVAPGAKVSLDISIDTDAPGRVGVRVANVPTGWIATLRGGGYAVDSIESNGSSATKLTLDVTVPAEATGTQRLNVVAVQGGASTTLPIDIRIEAAVAGSISMTTDTPELKGASDATFKFTLNLKNDTPDEQTFTVTSQGPVGWTVDTQVGSQAQAASVVIQAGSSSTVTVNAKPASDAEAGKYPIAVEATGGSQTAHVDLSVEITGSYAMTLSTQNGVLSTNASAGSVTDLTLVVANGGTAPIAGAAVTANAPGGWTVTFDPATVDVPANGSANVVAHMTPSSDAIAGDYMTTFKATADTASASADVRVTVQTSPLWGAVGIGIIALVLIGLLWVFRQFGRR